MDSLTTAFRSTVPPTDHHGGGGGECPPPTEPKRWRVGRSDGVGHLFGAAGVQRNMELSAQREIAVITTVQLHCLAFRTANTDYALMGCPPTQWPESPRIAVRSCMLPHKMALITSDRGA